MACQFAGLPAAILYADFPECSPERAALKEHLIRVARALREIQRTEEGNGDPVAEARAVRQCLNFLDAAPDFEEATASWRCCSAPYRH